MTMYVTKKPLRKSSFISLDDMLLTSLKVLSLDLMVNALFCWQDEGAWAGLIMKKSGTCYLLAVFITVLIILSNLHKKRR